ncbi:YegP family protein [Desulfovibrio mangrovi]|uniref:YegP family protein n=1 Tax=Desulfovibrio mangrovi TaxID=2976983 RepID=UPI0022481663|nr:YegP family protein [Desulfovibrio mangrovi]UZP69111.1 YegP family protein [Desulfovibrio mangrovi]
MGWFEILRAVDGQFYFNLMASNAKVILTSEMYTQKHNVQNGIQSVQTNSTDRDRFERKESANGEPYFVLRAKNHEVIGTSEMYSSNQARETGIASVMTNGPTKDIRDFS